MDEVKKSWKLTESVEGRKEKFLLFFSEVETLTMVACYQICMPSTESEGKISNSCYLTAAPPHSGLPYLPFIIQGKMQGLLSE